MNDTDLGMTLKVREMMQQRSAEERLKMGCSMFDMAQRLVSSSILWQAPNASPAHLRCRLFLRFYGNDFDAVTRKKILEYLRKTHP